MYGCLPKLPIDAALNFNPSIYFIDLDDYHLEVEIHFTQALTIIHDQALKAQEKYKQMYDKNENNIIYKIGDYVWKESQMIGKNKAKKLQPIFQGPYKIVNINYPNLFFENPNSSTGFETIHVNCSRLFLGRHDQENRKGENVPLANSNEKENKVMDDNLMSDCTQDRQNQHTYNLWARKRYL
uniref:Uncharacterized protein n=1 Tax=Romanomermis culicivorax TaxID=13658 RepID=A0A915INY1_ROMCU